MTLQKKIIMFIVINIIALIVQIFPYGIISMNYTSNFNGGIKFYYYTGNKAAPYNENNIKYEITYNASQLQNINFPINTNKLDNLRIDFENPKGTVGFESIKLYKLFIVTTVDNKQIKNVFSQMHGINEYKNGIYKY